MADGLEPMVRDFNHGGTEVIDSRCILKRTFVSVISDATIQQSLLEQSYHSLQIQCGVPESAVIVETSFSIATMTHTIKWQWDIPDLSDMPQELRDLITAEHHKLTRTPHMNTDTASAKNHVLDGENQQRFSLYLQRHCDLTPLIGDLLKLHRYDESARLAVLLYRDFLTHENRLHDIPLPNTPENSFGFSMSVADFSRLIYFGIDPQCDMCRVGLPENAWFSTVQIPAHLLPAEFNHVHFTAHDPRFTPFPKDTTDGQ